MTFVLSLTVLVMSGVGSDRFLLDDAIIAVAGDTPSATAGCPRHHSGGRLDESKARFLLQVEKDAGVPQTFRGFSIAAWCWETGYRTENYCSGQSCDKGKAAGPFQKHLSGGWIRTCGWETDRRRDFEASATCYIKRVVQRALENLEVCRTTAEAFASGQARVASYPKYWRDKTTRQRCTAVTNHIKLLRRWQRDSRIKEVLHGEER